MFGEIGLWEIGYGKWLNIKGLGKRKAKKTAKLSILVYISHSFYYIFHKNLTSSSSDALA